MEIGKKMPRKISKKGIVKKLNKIVSDYVIWRDKKCVTCGSTQKLGNGHLFSRSHQATKWDITDDGNCHCQCWPCNYLHVHNKYPYEKWYQAKFSMEKYDALYRRWNTVTSYKLWQLIELSLELKKAIEKKQK